MNAWQKWVILALYVAAMHDPEPLPFKGLWPASEEVNKYRRRA